MSSAQSYPNTPPTEHRSENTSCWGARSSPPGSRHTAWSVRTTDTASEEGSARIPPQLSRLRQSQLTVTFCRQTSQLVLDLSAQEATTDTRVWGFFFRWRSCNPKRGSGAFIRFAATACGKSDGLSLNLRSEVELRSECERPPNPPKKPQIQVEKVDQTNPLSQLWPAVMG